MISQNFPNSHSTVSHGAQHYTQPLVLLFMQESQTVCWHSPCTLSLNYKADGDHVAIIADRTMLQHPIGTQERPIQEQK